MLKQIITGFALLTCVVLHAQDAPDTNDSKKIKIGIKGGLSLPSLSDKSDNIYTQDFKSYASFEAGVFTEYALSDLLSVQVELNYTVKGGERKGFQPIPQNALPPGSVPAGTVLYANFDNKSALQYIEVPILAKAGFGEKWHFFANAGPYVGVLVGAKQKTSGLSRVYGDPFGLFPVTLPAPMGDNPLPFDAETDVKDSIKNFNVGMIAGIGVSKAITSKSELLFEIRGTYGFIPVQEDKVFGESKIGSVLFSLGYIYNL